MKGLTLQRCYSGRT